jgi:hypothetical protein
MNKGVAETPSYRLSRKGKKLQAMLRQFSLRFRVTRYNSRGHARFCGAVRFRAISKSDQFTQDKYSLVLASLLSTVRSK